MKKKARHWLWLGVSVVVLVLIAYHISRGGEWRHFRWDRLWAALLDANPYYLLAAVLATLSSYVVRAFRWGYFLDPIKKVSLRVLFTGQIVGFAAIYLLGRPGEIVRPGYIANRSGVSYSSMAAVWFLERIFDTVFVALLFSASLFLVPISWEGIATTSSSGFQVASYAHIASLLILIVTAFFIALLVYFRMRADRGPLKTPRFLSFLSAHRQEQFEHFLRSFADGLGVIQNFKDLWASVASTAVLWFINVSFFWLVFRSVGGDVGQLSWMAAAMILFFGVLGLIVQIPGLGGGVQLAMIKTMTGLMGIGAENATGASILLWIALMVPCVVLALILLVHEGLSFKKLETIAEEERAETVVEN